MQQPPPNSAGSTTSAAKIDESPFAQTPLMALAPTLKPEAAGASDAVPPARMPTTKRPQPAAGVTAPRPLQRLHCTILQRDGSAASGTTRCGASRFD